MTNRIILYGTLFVTIVFLSLFFMNALLINNEHDFEILNPEEISNIGVEVKGKTFLLNFNQQLQFIELLNKSNFAKDEISKNNPLQIEKISIYFLNKNPIILKPVALIKQEFLFSAPEIVEKGLVKDQTNGKLYQLLEKTYD